MGREGLLLSSVTVSSDLSPPLICATARAPHPVRSLLCYSTVLITATTANYYSHNATSMVSSTRRPLTIRKQSTRTWPVLVSFTRVQYTNASNRAVLRVAQGTTSVLVLQENLLYEYCTYFVLVSTRVSKRVQVREFTSTQQ